MTYKSKDGKEFTSESECLKHEAELDKIRNAKEKAKKEREADWNKVLEAYEVADEAYEAADKVLKSYNEKYADELSFGLYDPFLRLTF